MLIIPDKVILDHKKSNLVSFENFHFFRYKAKIGHKQTLHKKKLYIGSWMKRDQTQNHNQDLNPKPDPNQKNQNQFLFRFRI